MIRLFKNVFLMPYGMFNYYELPKFDVILLEDRAEAYTTFDESIFVAYNSTLSGLVADKFNGDERAFFSYLAHYQSDRHLAIFAPRHELAKIFLRFLVELYPNGTDEDLEHLYQSSLDKIGLILDGKMMQFAPSRRNLILECYVTLPELKKTLDDFRLTPLGVMDDDAKKNLAFEWLYLDYLVNGTDSAYLLQLVEQLKSFLYPHFIVLHDAVCSMNNLQGATTIPLKLKHDLDHVDHRGKTYKSEIDSSEIDVDTFIKTYGSYVKSTVEE